VPPASEEALFNVYRVPSMYTWKLLQVLCENQLNTLGKYAWKFLGCFIKLKLLQ
jgi:hypothetical protein